MVGDNTDHRQIAYNHVYPTVCYALSIAAITSKPGDSSCIKGQEPGYDLTRRGVGFALIVKIILPAVGVVTDPLYHHGDGR